MITCTASSSHRGSGGRVTGWATQDKGIGEWIQVNFASPVTIKEMKLLNRVHYAGQIKEIEYLFDDKKVQKSSLKGGSKEFTVISLPRAVTTKTIRITISKVKKGQETGGHDFGFKEIEVIGCFQEREDKSQVPACTTGKKVPNTMITCTASSTHRGGWGCEKAFDGILDKGLLFGPGGRVTGWATQDKGIGEWMQINF